MFLTLEEAERIAAQVCALAAEKDIAISVAVSDGAGDLLLLKRMDGALALTPRLASAKAYTAAMIGKSTGSWAKVAVENAPLFATAQALASTPLAPGAGGVALLRAKRVVGAVGVSGGPPDVDEVMARAGADGASPNLTVC